MVEKPFSKPGLPDWFPFTAFFSVIFANHLCVDIEADGPVVLQVSSITIFFIDLRSRQHSTIEVYLIYKHFIVGLYILFQLVQLLCGPDLAAITAVDGSIKY